MASTPRTVTAESLENQARMLGMELIGVDLNVLLARVRSGIGDVERLDELAPGEYEPAVKFDSEPESKNL